MTTITKAAQQALEALEEIALAGMSGSGQESEEGMRDWHARQAWKFIGVAARALEPLRAALTLPAPQQATPKPVVPEMSSIALRKLGGLQDRGWQINGYAIRRGNERGFVDASGFVGWWRSEIAPVVPDGFALVPVSLLIEAEESVDDYLSGIGSGSHDRRVRENLQAAIAASQQKGGQ